MTNSHKLFLTLILAFFAFTVSAKSVVFSKKHGVTTGAFFLTMTVDEGTLEEGECIRYSRLGDVPVSTSTTYTGKIRIDKTTVIRAAVFKGEEMISDVTTATFILPLSTINQSNTPSGYPSQWGPYASIKGTAKADYEMDPEMTGDENLRSKIIEGLSAIPTLSIVTDKDYFFSKELDEQKGGIYIYTGAPVGSGEGRDWERPVSMELFGGSYGHDITIDCGIKMHGGHSRLPEKNPKHSLRLLFKSKYGPSKLKYNVFPDGGPSKFDKLVLRCGFGNSWQHWLDDNRVRAQYSRDMWARNIQRLMGQPCSRGLYVHVYINGLYWGMYNIAERVDDYYCSSNLGGEKADYDVIKVEEYGGAWIEASEGTIDKWNEMVALTREVPNDYGKYRQLIGVDEDGKTIKDAEVLLDVDNFIDYMLINQYGGNTDWDHHNWLAVRNRVKGTTGFRFICWDTEMIFHGAGDNVLGTYNNGSPTEILRNLMNSQAFRHRYMDRAYEHLVKEGGLLTAKRAEEVWDSLYSIIEYPLYAEAARWGDYRRDVHPYTSAGKLNTVDGRFMTERNRLKTSYFPYRTANFIQQLKAKGWYSEVQEPKVYVNGAVADETDTISIKDIITLAAGTTVYYTLDGTAPVSWLADVKGILSKTIKKSSGGNILEGYDGSKGDRVTLRAIAKGDSDWSPAIERTFVIRELVTTGIDNITYDNNKSRTTARKSQSGTTYMLNGQRIPEGAPVNSGIYIKDGKKMLKGK